MKCWVVLLLTVILGGLTTPLPPSVYYQLPAVAQTGNDLENKADQLFQQGIRQFKTSQFAEALQSWEQALEIYQAIGNRQKQVSVMGNLAIIYDTSGQHKQAIALYEQVLAITQQISDHAGEGRSLVNLGIAYNNLKQHHQAIKYLEQGLEILRQIGDRAGEGRSLINLGLAHKNLGQYQQAIELYEQGLVIIRETGDLTTEFKILRNLANVYLSLGQKQKAVAIFEQQLAIVQSLQNPVYEREILFMLGRLQVDLGYYTQALESLQLSLTIAKRLGDLENEGLVLNALGVLTLRRGNYPQALSYFEQVLDILKNLNETQGSNQFRSAGEARILGNIGSIHFSLGNYSEALETLEKSLPILRQIGDSQAEGNTMNIIAGVHLLLGDASQALSYSQQALEIFRKINDRFNEGITLDNIGVIYSNLGSIDNDEEQYSRALKYLLEALSVFREIANRNGEAVTLSHLGSMYNRQGNFTQALKYLKQALILRSEINDRAEEATLLNNVGRTFGSLSQYSEALNHLQQARIILNDMGDRRGEGTTLNFIAHIYSQQENNTQALLHFERALAIFSQIGDREQEARTLSSIGFLLDAKEQTRLAIIFFKKSINIYEEIRKDTNQLSEELQYSYTETIANSYRNLAKLLLEEKRVMEALQVLDLLKVQELQDFFKDVQGNERTAQGIEMLDEEQQLLDEMPVEQIDDYLNSPRVNSLVQKIRKTAPEQNLKLSAYIDLQTRLKNLGNNSALLYPLILENRIELILFTRNAPPINESLEIETNNLESTVAEFRNQIQNPNSNSIRQSAKQLYDWIIEPIEDDLKKHNIQTIIYAPDGQMRYVPLGALYDGEKWLIENYQINYITALSLTDIRTQSFQQPKILAGAFTDISSQIKVGEKEYNFNSIPFAQDEVEEIKTKFSNTTETLLNDNFNRQSMINSKQLNRYNVVHLATHGQLVSGNPEESFILFNNNEYISLKEIQDLWQLPNVALVVLSACQTALGDRLESGIEIIGFGYQIQQTQARAAIASLWNVSDYGTNYLMKEFYNQLEKNSTNPVDALRKAQIALIEGERDVSEVEERATISLEGDPKKIATQLKHPYYWAPFILIGNGL